ncbi:MAG: hypothetical protein LBV34_06005 [Nocardiopsaceae bacterium]|nr:hypothetical protein [Nocardiopsaceae bacterium]
MTTAPTRRHRWLRRVFKIAFALAALVAVVMIGLPPVFQGVIVGALTVIALSQPPTATIPTRRRSWLRRVLNIVLALAALAGVAVIVIPRDGLPLALQGGLVGGLAVVVVRRLWRGADK